VKYQLDGFPLDDFTRADALVRATVLASGRVETWNSIRLVTSDLTHLPKSDRDRVASAASKDGTFFRACCLPCAHNEYEADLWFNPLIVDGSDRFRATVLHELCHVYLGVKAEHGDRWRRLYARVLYHYHYEVSPINHWHSLVTLANWSYTKRGKSESSGQLLRRINGDKEKWIRQANEEHDKVIETWTKMTSRS
jgi:hypothetical protein